MERLFQRSRIRSLGPSKEDTQLISRLYATISATYAHILPGIRRDRLLSGKEYLKLERCCSSLAIWSIDNSAQSGDLDKALKLRSDLRRVILDTLIVMCSILMESFPRLFPSIETPELLLQHSITRKVRSEARKAIYQDQQQRQWNEEYRKPPSADQVIKSLQDCTQSLNDLTPSLNEPEPEVASHGTEEKALLMLSCIQSIYPDCPFALARGISRTLLRHPCSDPKWATEQDVKWRSSRAVALPFVKLLHKYDHPEPAKQPPVTLSLDLAPPLTIEADASIPSPSHRPGAVATTALFHRVMRAPNLESALMEEEKYYKTCVVGKPTEIGVGIMHRSKGDIRCSSDSDHEVSCGTCNRSISTRLMGIRARLHALGDLYPYMCLDRKCDSAFVQIESKPRFIKHILVHKELTRPGRCHFCGLNGKHQDTPEKMAVHLAQHLEDIAILLFLPDPLRMSPDKQAPQPEEEAPQQAPVQDVPVPGPSNWAPKDTGYTVDALISTLLSTFTSQLKHYEGGNFGDEEDIRNAKNNLITLAKKCGVGEARLESMNPEITGRRGDVVEMRNIISFVRSEGNIGDEYRYGKICRMEHLIESLYDGEEKLRSGGLEISHR